VKSPTSTILDAPSLVPVSAGTAVTLVAHVTPATLTGSVRFFDGQTPVGAPVPVVSGVARLVTTALPLGAHALTAQVVPTGTSYAASGSTAESLVVTAPHVAAAGAVRLATSVHGSVPAGSRVTLIADVGPAGATGTVEFFADDSSLGAPVTVADGSARTATSTLAIGRHRITASFVPADSSAVTSAVSPVASLVVSAPAAGRTTTGLDVTPTGPVVAGTRLTASVATFPTDVSGTVTIYDSGIAVGDPVTVAGGQADISLPPLPVGTHWLTAGFEPDDAARLGSTSQASFVTVTPVAPTAAPTTTTLTVTPGQISLVGESVVLGVTVTPSTAVGDVEILDDATVIAHGSVLNGSWTGPATTLAVGTHSLTARFVPADVTRFAASQTPAAQQIPVVRPAAGAVVATLTATPGSAPRAGTAVTLTTTVNPADAQGYVTVSDSGRPIALVTLVAGKAVWTVVAVGAGAHSYTAGFTPADPRFFAPAATAPLALTAGPAATPTAAAAAPRAVSSPTPAAVTTPAPTTGAASATGSAGSSGAGQQLASTGLAPALVDSGTNAALLPKTGSDSADLTAMAVLLLLLGGGLLGLARAMSRSRAPVRAADVRASGAGAGRHATAH
jgi:LPXTG-motif cell wall-anchored protein